MSSSSLVEVGTGHSLGLAYLSDLSSSQIQYAESSFGGTALPVGAIPSVNLASPETLQTITTTVDWLEASQALLQVYVSMTATMLTTGGNDLLSFSYLATYNGTDTPSSQTGGVYVRTINDPTGVALCLIGVLNMVAGTGQNLVIRIDAVSAVGDNYSFIAQPSYAVLTRLG